MSFQYPCFTRGDIRLRIFSLVCVFLSFLLGACGAKNVQQAELLLPEKTTPAGARSLSVCELKALKSSGQIDCEVPDSHMADVAREYEYYLRKGRPGMRASSKNAEKYLSYAKNVFRARGMPEDLAYLAIIESGYRPDARSRVGAAGAWQFMPETGIRFGLRQDWWVDERLDPYKSTEAAAAYLEKLYNDFGDWSTAIAAYNAGEGKISRAKAGTGGSNFFEVKALNHTLDYQAQLREETRKYVPKFMAVSKIMRNLPELGFEPIKPDASPAVLRYAVQPGTDLRALSSACSLNWKEFQAYNRHHKRNISCTDRITFVYVPSCAKESASAFLQRPGRAPYAGWAPVKVQSPRDSWEKLSARSNVPVSRLKEANPEKTRIRAGDVLLLPANINMSSRVLASAERTFKAKTLPGPTRAGVARAEAGPSGSLGKARKRNSYVVKEKDSLWRIARNHAISVDDLKKWNNVDEKGLRPGRTLFVERD